MSSLFSQTVEQVLSVLTFTDTSCNFHVLPVRLRSVWTRYQIISRHSNNNFNTRLDVYLASLTPSLPYPGSCLWLAVQTFRTVSNRKWGPGKLKLLLRVPHPLPWCVRWCCILVEGVSSHLNRSVAHPKLVLSHQYR